MASYAYSTPYQGMSSGPLPPGYMEAAMRPGENLAQGIRDIGKTIERYADGNKKKKALIATVNAYLQDGDDKKKILEAMGGMGFQEAEGYFKGAMALQDKIAADEDRMVKNNYMTAMTSDLTSRTDAGAAERKPLPAQDPNLTPQVNYQNAVNEIYSRPDLTPDTRLKQLDLLRQTFGNQDEVTPLTMNGVMTGLVRTSDGRVVSLPKTTGAALTDSQGKALTFSVRMANNERMIDQIMKSGKWDPTGIIASNSYVPEIFKSEQRKLYEAASRNWIAALLRRESGAAISDSEYENGMKQYFPLPKDTESVLKFKASNRRKAFEGIRAEVGPSIDNYSKMYEEFGVSPESGIPDTSAGVNPGGVYGGTRYASVEEAISKHKVGDTVLVYYKGDEKNPPGHYPFTISEEDKTVSVK